MTRFRVTVAAVSILFVAGFFAVALHSPASLRLDGRDFAIRDVQLNTFTHSLQERVALASDEEGSILATWESRRQESGGYGIFARRLDARGLARGGEIHVNETLPGHQQHPVAVLDDSGAFIAWNSWGQTGPGSAVMGRSLDGREKAIAAGAGIHEIFSAAGLPGGLRLLAWSSPDGEGGSRVMAGRFDAGGEPLGEAIAVSQGEGALDRVAGVDVFDGGFRVAWAREIPGAGPVGVLSRGFDRMGRPLGGEQMLVPGGIEPSLACAADGHFVLAWMDARKGSYVAAARLFDADGRPAGDLILPDPDAGAESGATVATRNDGSFALAWNRVEDLASADLFLRLYDPEARALGAAFRATGASQGRQMLAVASGARRLVYGDDGRLAVAWTGDSGHGDKSAANVSLILPDAGLADRAAWAWSDLSARLRPRRAGSPATIAAPHVPPTFHAPGEPVFEAETSFTGDRFRDEGFRLFTSTGWTPPDPHAAVGPEHVIGMVNGGIACYEKNGAFLWQADISGNAFWNADWFVFDPEVIYDPHSGRFMAMACERGDNNHSYFDYAVSIDSTPTNSSSEWYKYRIDVTSWTGNDIDSPNMAVTDGEVYLTADFFGPDKYGILIIDKSSVLSGGTPVTTHILHTGSQSMGIPVVYDTGRGMVMLEDAETWSSSSLKIWAIQDPLGSPTLVSTTFPVDTYWMPVSVRSMGTSAQITTFESRFWSCVERNGKLWATHHVCPTSDRNSLAARWYEIDLNGWPDSPGAPFVAQSGDVLPNGEGYASFCSISVNGIGQAALDFTYSSPTEYLDMYRVMRNPSDTPGTMQAAVLQKASGSSYSGNRWGDYSSIVVDPVDDKSFWSHGEYTPGAGSWSTWTSSFDPGGGTGVGADFPHYAVHAGGVWPNPTGGEARFAFELPAAANVSMDIFDVRGRRVRTLGGGEFGEGRGHIVWDGRDARGNDLPAGVYLARFDVGGRMLPGGSVTLLR